MSYNIPKKILTLIEYYVDEASKQINNKRPEVAPVDLTEFFTNNPSIKFFKVISKNKGNDIEHNFAIEVIVNQKTNKPTGQANLKDLKTNCEDLRSLSTLLYGNTFEINFGSCGKTIIKNSVMIKTYTDFNGAPVNSYPIDFEEAEPIEKRVGVYYNLIKVLKVGEYAHIDQAGSVNKYDGEVIRHDGNAMQLTMSKHGSKSEFNLNLDLSQNPFYIEDNNIMFKGEATRPKDFDSGDDSVDREEFIIAVKSFKTTTEPVKEKKPKKKIVPNEDDDEKLKSDGKKAMDIILNDPLLKQAFYKQPSLWNLFKAELQGKKAVGTGIIPTLALVNRYEVRRNTETLGAEFFEGKELYFRILNQNVSIPYKNKYNENSSLVLEKNLNYIGKVATHELGANTKIDAYLGKEKTHYNIFVKNKTGEANVFYCDIVKSDDVEDGRDNKTEAQVRFIIKDAPYDGYRPLSFEKQNPKKAFKNNR